MPNAVRVVEPIPGLALLEAYGHSYTINDGGNAGYTYIDRLAYALGARRRNNRGWGGSVSCWPQGGISGDGGYAWVLQNATRPGSPVNGTIPAHPESAAAPYLPRAQLAVHHQALNDLAILGSTNLRPMKEAHRTIWSRLCATALWEESASAWAFTGTWTTNAQTTANSGIQIKYSTTVNDKATFTVPSDYPGGLVVAIGCFVNAAQDVTVGVKVDGVSQPDARFQGSVLCDQSAANKNIGVVLRFGRATSGGQLSPFDYPVTVNAGSTIELTLKTQTIGSSLLGIDYAQIEADPLDGPILVVPRPNRLYTYTIWNTYPHGPSAGTDPVNDAAIATWDTAVQSIGPEFPDRVVFVDIDTPLAKARVNFQSDDAHPTGRGFALVTDAVRSVVIDSGLLTQRVVDRAVPDAAPFFEPVGTAGRAVFTNSWTNYSSSGTGAAPFGWHWHLDRSMELRGAVKNGSLANSTVVTIGAGARPAQDRYLASASGAAGNIKIGANGNISYSSGGSTTFQPFDGVRYSVEA